MIGGSGGSDIEEGASSPTNAESRSPDTRQERGGGEGGGVWEEVRAGDVGGGEGGGVWEEVRAGRVVKTCLQAGNDYLLYSGSP